MSGEAVDPSEIRLVGKIAAMASAAIDHIEAIELRRRVETMSKELAWYRQTSKLDRPLIENL